MKVLFLPPLLHPQNLAALSDPYFPLMALD